MATYAIGDIQGCYNPLICLLEEAAFDPYVDRLWVAGDMVNRGPDSLAVVRFLKSLGDSVSAVLGNHDLHCLAMAWGFQQAKPKDTLGDFFEATDRDELLGWLRGAKMIHRDPDLGFTMVHAGIPPNWSIDEALARGRELEAVLHGERCPELFATMYGNTPDCWGDSLEGPDRWRVITNYFTRMRFCDAAGRLELTCKLGPDRAPPGFAPWYSHPHRRGDERILFGHWASLQGHSPDPERLFPLDSGCVWGRQLSMLRLEDRKWFRCDCKVDSGQSTVDSRP